MIMASLLTRAAALCAAVVLLSSAPARAAAGSESTPVDLTGASTHTSHAGGSGSIVRTIVGLAVVIGVIYGVAWVLKQVKAGKEERSTGAGLASVASVPLGPGRAVHLVRAGSDLVLVGVTESGITPLRTYDEGQARAAGLIDEDGDLILPTEAAPRERSRLALPSRLSKPRLALPKPRLALPAPRAQANARATAASSAAAANRRAPKGLVANLRAMTVRR